MHLLTYLLTSVKYRYLDPAALYYVNIVTDRQTDKVHSVIRR